jgi:hypothetical protein
MDVRARVDALRNDPNVRGKYLNQLFPQKSLNMIPYQLLRYHQCIFCGRTVEQYDMEPPDMVNPKPMHSKCFNRLAVRISKKCLICKNILSQDKIDAQSHSPNDSYYRICDGYCIDYFSIVSCKIFGDDMTFIADELELQPLYKQQSSKKQQGYQKSNLPLPQLKPQPIIPSDKLWEDLRVVNSYMLTREEGDFFYSGQMNLEEKRYYLIKRKIVVMIHSFHKEINFATDDTQRNIFFQKRQEYMAKFHEINNQMPSQRYLSRTGQV